MKCHLHPDRDAAGYCVSCGQGVCAECKREVLGTIRCPAHSSVVVVAPPRTKSGFLAGLSSLMFPGLGHLYAGAYQRAIKFGGLAVALIVVLSTGHEHLAVLFGLSLFFDWAYATFDAIRVCHDINAGVYSEPANAALPIGRARTPGTGSLTLGIILLGFGILFLGDRYIDLDKFFDFVGDNIGFIFIGLGIVLLATYARRRGRERERELAASAPPSEPLSSSSTSSFLK